MLVIIYCVFVNRFRELCGLFYFIQANGANNKYKRKLDLLIVNF